MSYRQAAVIGLALGITAALVVWYLERFETRRMFSEIDHYLERYDGFREFLQSKNQKEGGQGGIPGT